MQDNEGSKMSDRDFTARQADELLRRERWPVVRTQLPDICEEVGRFCLGSYTYSLHYLGQRVGWSQAIDPLHRCHDLATSIGNFFRLCGEDMSPRLSSEQMEAHFEMVCGIVSLIHHMAIEPLVRFIRSEGSVQSEVFDGYGEFKRRWNDLIQRIEGLGRTSGLQVRLSMYVAPELGVQLKS